MRESDRSVLVVDDEASQRSLLSGFLTSCGLVVEEASSAEEALEAIRARPPGLVLLDVKLPGMSGLEALARIRKMSTPLPVLLLTAHADLRQAVSAMKTGADDYLAKPVDLEELRTAVFDLLGRFEKDLDRPDDPAALPPGIVCESPAMRSLVRTVLSIARSDAPVLVLGESGTGKEVVATLLHQHSSRSARPLVVANCATLSESLIESDLFGHVKGAFTGAQAPRQGLFRAADTGTLFLDEIGEMPLALQPKLLRALETGQVVPVGGDAPTQVDVRLISATNRDLSTEALQQKFREDLYYRLAVIELVVPPLRERHEDILPLVQHFARGFSEGAVRLSPQAAASLVGYAWPGNVRELRNAIQRACLLSRGDVILPEHLPPKVVSGAGGAAAAPNATATLSDVERAAILAALAECDGNRTRAARKLGISRRGLIYKLKAIEADDRR